MTAAVSTPPAASRPAPIGRLPGFGRLVSKELLEWRRGKRAWVVLLVSTSFMALAAMSAWINNELAPLQPEPVPLPSLDPFVNLAAAVSSQIFVIVAVFATMSLLVAERESGTLSWTASKPVSRGAIWLAKWASASGILWLLAGLVPLAATVAVVLWLYGSPPALAVVILALGIGMMTALIVAISLAAATLVRSQAAVAAITIAAIFLPEIVAGLVPIREYLPTSILQWSIVLAAGEPAGIWTPLAWAVAVAALAFLGVRRLERLEL
jgi:ABC-type transport system involved in multi-copper enzyme maturation permease subunit